MTDSNEHIDNTEDVARILHRSWVINGILQHYAFVLRRNETYLSVNRPAKPSYNSDVTSFVSAHPDFYSNEDRTEYMRALINVGGIRETEITTNGIKLNIEVEVEPRDSHTKSHAGIFTRHEGHNIKYDETLHFATTEDEVSSNEVLLEVRYRLLKLAHLEKCALGA